MNLPDLKQLDKLIVLCRKRGVKVIKIDNMELILNEELPNKPIKASAKTAPAPTNDIFQTDTLTDEQLLNWSVMEVPVPGAPGEETKQ